MTTPCNETDQTDLKKGSWSDEEDQKLISYIKRYGIWNWSQMPRFAGLSRSGKSCRLRWMNYLKPNVKRGKFSQEEEEIVLESHSLLGNRWSAIASRLPGRTDNDVKNHWHTHLKKRKNEHILECLTTEQNDRNRSPASEANNDDILHESSNHGDYIFESAGMTFENDGSSSTCTTTSKDHDLEFRHNYCDVGSPGTIDDLQCFWDQLCPVENLENVNNHPDVFLDPTFQDLYEDPFSSFNFYDNANNISIFADP